MADIREVILTWTFENGRESKTVLYFSPWTVGSSPIPGLRTIFDGLKNSFGSVTRVRFPSAGNVIDDATGELVGAWTEAAVADVAGTNASQPVQNASMLLMRWNTAAIVNGRRIKGRAFLPGVSAACSNGGQVDIVTVNNFKTAFANIGSSLGLRVWHRPNAKGPGSSHVVTGVDVWNEWATWRPRRA